MIRTLKLMAKGVVCGVLGVPFMLMLCLGGALVAVSLLAIFAIMDVLNSINGNAQ